MNMMKKIQLTIMITIIIIGDVLSQPDCPPCDCVLDTTFGGVKAVCSHLELTSFPQTIPTNTTTLLMDYNHLTNQSLRTFPTLRHLRYLDMSFNFIRKIDDDVFTGLTHLEVLILDDNYLLYSLNSVFDANFLKPLTSLKNISLCQLLTSSMFNVTYECTSCPHSLESFYINCDSCKFGSSFLKLRRLSFLTLDPFSCSMHSLDNSTFQHLPYLEILNMSNCLVNHVDTGMFESLQKLRILDMNVNVTNGDEFNVFMEVTKSLQYSSIEYISFTSYRTSKSNPDMFLYIQNTSLVELHIRCAKSIVIPRENFLKLPKSLVVLSLIGIQYSGILSEIRDHPSLKALDLSNLAYPLPMPNDFFIANLSPILESYTCRNCPSLSDRCVIYRKNITTFITPYNKWITNFNSIVFRSFKNVEYLDLSHNEISNFQPLQRNVITYLNLASNHLGDSLTGSNTSALESMLNVNLLDLSDNGVSFVSLYAFEHLHDVKVINLSSNHLSAFNVRLNKLLKMEVLDLRKNKISMIGSETRKDLGKLPRANLHLEGNPLICGCEELESLIWMKQNIARIKNISSLECRILSGDYKSLDNLDQIVSNLQAQCKSNIFEISVSVCVTISFMAVVGAVLVYRHRWKLRYLYYAGRRGYRQRYNREVVREHYEFDAFVSYEERDRRFVIDEMMPELEEKHGLKLCIHHRDFLPGELISENIVNAIQNSRKTIVVLSPSFLESSWCEFEFNMARMEGVTRRQDVVLVLLYEEVPMMKLSKDMATMLKRNCYLEYNHEVFNKEVFWLLVQESVQIIRPQD